MGKEFAMILLSYNYDEIKYKKGDFTTYSGIISIYNEKLKKTKDIVYVNGKVTQETVMDCPRCLMPCGCGGNQEVTHNWCVEFPSICSTGGGSGSGGSSEENQSIENPPDGDTYVAEVVADASTPEVDYDNNVTGGYNNATIPDFDASFQTWPTIDNVIPLSDWIHLNNPHDNCLNLAKEQLARKNYQISNYNEPNQTYQVYTTSGGVNLGVTKNAVSYLVDALSNNIPVLVGIDNQPGSSNPGTDKSTDHFVVIVAMGTDANGKYFRFYDSATSYPWKGTSNDNKLYYTSSGLITGKSKTSYATSQSYMHDYIVTMVRKSKSL